MVSPSGLPDPALVVLVGVSGAGKSTWAAARYRPEEVVSSDELRSRVGHGPHDLDASTDAFALLDRIVAARVRRGLTTVVDTLGLDADRRRAFRDLAVTAGLPTVAVLVDTPPRLCRSRNAARDLPVPAAVLDGQLRSMHSAPGLLATEGWDRVVRAGDAGAPEAGHVRGLTTAAAAQDRDPRRLEIVLQVSRFPWGEDLAGWLREVALAADESGFSGLALMDHLIQIPQVGRAWDPIPEPWVTLGLLAGLDTSLRLGTLVSPVTFRAAGIIAKTAATLDVLCGGRAFVGVGAGWWDREHAAFGLPFPGGPERLDALEAGIETMRALWAPGTKAYDGRRVRLPETTSYPRPSGDIPIIVGGSGERRTLRIAAQYADACNVPSDLDRLPHRIEVLRRHCAEVGRDPAEVAVTVLDVPIVGADRAAVAAAVERLRGRTPAGVFAARHHAGTLEEQIGRYRLLAEQGVSTVFVALPELTGGDDVRRVAGLTAAFAG